KICLNKHKLKQNIVDIKYTCCSTGILDGG
ncbi:MAG: hypothetical protein ACI8UC_000836, partial [Psychromonas sp.]